LAKIVHNSQHYSEKNYDANNEHNNEHNTEHNIQPGKAGYDLAPGPNQKNLLDKTDTVKSFLCQRGIEFEAEVLKLLRQKYPDIPTILNIEKEGPVIRDADCEKTIQYMSQGIPIIHSAPFRLHTHRYQGIVDLLVRSDHLSKILDNYKGIDRNDTRKLPDCTEPNKWGYPHYVAIDIKFTTLAFAADGIHILNTNNFPAYKGQLYIYTTSIGHIQGYTSRYAYLLGRRWTRVSRGILYNSMSCLDKLGCVDYEGRDKVYAQKTEQAIKWLRKVDEEGFKWSLFTARGSEYDGPEQPELYPNMAIDSGYWQTVKKAMAEKIGDITQIWYCGVKQRETAFNQGVRSWRDPRCTVDLLNITGVRRNVINAILDINKQNVDLVRPAKITTNLFQWREEGNEMFVDFETFLDIFSEWKDMPRQPKTDRIFMIGVWYKNNYNCFQLEKREGDLMAEADLMNDDDLMDEAEFTLMNNFVQFWRENGCPKIWYWYAENSIWNKAENRMMDRACSKGDVKRADHIVNDWQFVNFNPSVWADLCLLFRTEPIVVKGCYKFGLKEIAGGLHRHGLIQTKWPNNLGNTPVIHNGVEAACQAWTDMRNGKDLTEVRQYNEIDVKVLSEILNYIRNNH
jgi:hypothetical protein